MDGELAVFDRPYQETDGICKVVNIIISSTDSDPFGEVSTGLLKLSGKLKQAWRILDRETYDGDKEVQFFYDQPYQLTSWIESFRLKLGPCELDIFDEVQQLYSPESTWFCRVTNSGGLILNKILDGQFQRIGIFELDEDKLGWFDNIEPQEIGII